MNYENAIVEMKLEAEEAVIKKVESIIQSKSEFNGLDKSFWSEQIYKMSSQDKTIAKLRAENRALKKTEKDYDKLRSFAGEMYEQMECCPHTGGEKKDISYYIDKPLEQQGKQYSKGICDELSKQIKEQKEKIEELEHDLDVFKERVDEKCKKISELEDDLEQKYDMDDAIEIIMENPPACVENQIIRNALEDGEVVTYEAYDEIETYKDDYEQTLDDSWMIYKSKCEKGIHTDDERFTYQEDLPKVVEQLYRKLELTEIDRNYYKAGYESLKESSGEEVAIEMMEKIMNKTKDIAEKDIERVEKIQHLQQKINILIIGGIQHQYKTRQAILDKCDEWKEDVIDIHNY